MGIAEEVSSRATCDRKHVGAVIVRDRDILCTGYNGSISGDFHCDEHGHLMIDQHCRRTIHAEVNAISRAAKNGIRLDDAVIYITAYPCWECFKVLCNVGIKTIYYREKYRCSDIVAEVAERLSVKLIQV